MANSKHDSSPAPDRAKSVDDAVDFRREAPSESDVAAIAGGKSGSSRSRLGRISPPAKRRRRSGFGRERRQN